MTRNIDTRGTSSAGTYLDQSFSVGVTATTSIPTAINLALAGMVTAGAPVGTIIGTLSTNDPNVYQTFTYVLLPGANSDLFRIDGNLLKTNKPLLNVSPQTYPLRVKMADSLSFSFTLPLSVTVQPSGMPPTDIALSNQTIPAGKPVGTVIGTLSASDPNCGVSNTFTLTGPDSGLFRIAADGQTLQTAVVFKSSDPQLIHLEVVARNTLGQSITRTLPIAVHPGMTLPASIALSSTVTDAGLLAGIVDSTLGTAEPGTQAIAVASFTGAFGIDGHQLKVRVVFKNTARLRPDTRHETEEATVVLCRDETGQLSGTPHSVGPNSNDTFTPPGTTATDNEERNGTTLASAIVFQVSALTSFEVEFPVTDSARLALDKTFTLAVEPSASLPIANSEGSGGLPVGSEIGTLSMIVPTAEASFTFSIRPTLDPTTDLPTTRRCTLDTGQNPLRSNTVIRVRGSNRFPVTIRTTDTLGLTFDPILPITVTPANDVSKTPETRSPSSVETTLAESLPASPRTGDAAPIPATLPLTAKEDPTPPPPLSVPVSLPPVPQAVPTSGATKEAAATTDSGAKAAPRFQPEIYTISATASADDQIYHAPVVAKPPVPMARPQPVVLPTDQVFLDLQAQEHRLGALVDASLWVAKPVTQLPDELRAKLDLLLFGGTGEERMKDEG